MKAKKIIGKVLIAFLLVSIGVAIGKEMAARNAPATVEPVTAAGETKVVVYYMHGIPCITCMFIETTTEKLVRQEFAQPVRAGKMEFVSLNYLDPANAALAEKYRVGGNMVIAVRALYCPRSRRISFKFSYKFRIICALIIIFF